MDVGDVGWPIITVAVTNLCTLAVVIANAFFRIQALAAHNRAILDQFRQQNKQLDRVERASRTVAAIAPVIVASALNPATTNTTVNVGETAAKE